MCECMLESYQHKITTIKAVMHSAADQHVRFQQLSCFALTPLIAESLEVWPQTQWILHNDMSSIVSAIYY